MIRWAIRLAVITLFLGLVGTALILYRIHDKDREIKLIKPGTETALRKDSLKEGVQVQPTSPKTSAIPKDTISASTLKQAIVEKKIDTTAIAPLTAEKIDDTPAPQSGAMAAPKERATPQVRNIKKPARKLFNLKELKGIAKIINRLKQENKGFANCVQIQITAEEFNRKLLTQTETFLKRRRFTIAGKEVIAKKIRGVKIKMNGACIKLTIGAF